MYIPSILKRQKFILTNWRSEAPSWWNRHRRIRTSRSFTAFACKEKSEHYLAQQCNLISRNLSWKWRSPERSHFLLWFGNRQRNALSFKEKWQKFFSHSLNYRLKLWSTVVIICIICFYDIGCKTTVNLKTTGPSSRGFSNLFFVTKIPQFAVFPETKIKNLSITFLVIWSSLKTRLRVLDI